MDLRAFYQKIRDAAAAIEEPFPMVVSLATADGGKEGMPIEVTRQLAAKMIVEGSARLASAEEARQFREQQAEAKTPGGSSGGRDPGATDGADDGRAEPAEEAPGKPPRTRRTWLCS